MPGWETALLRRRLATAGFAPHLFRFRSVRDGLGTNAARLARFAAGIEGEPLHFVGYSLGGVVVLAMLASGALQRPGRVVCLGSPLRGSESGRRLAGLPAAGRIVGRSVRDLNSRGGLPPWPGTRDVGVLAGDVALGMGRLLGRPLGSGDGTVAIVETRLPGIRDHLVVHESHASLLFSREVAEQTAYFLVHGRFDRNSS